VNPLARIKRLTAMIFRRNPLRVFSLPRSGYDWRTEVGDGTGSSTVMAPIQWAARTFPEAPPMLWQRSTTARSSPFATTRCCGCSTGRTATTPRRSSGWRRSIDWMVDGNAYWIKIRDKIGNCPSSCGGRRTG
jgi:hypothetical protein